MAEQADGVGRRLRRSIRVDDPGGRADEWRDDLRLFLVAWASGFLFFMVLIA